MVKRTHFSSVTGDFVPDDFMPADGDLVKQKDYDKAIKQRDQLREALKEAEQLQRQHYGDGMGLHMAMCLWADKARAALKATE